FDASNELMLEAILPRDPAAMAPMVMRYAVDPNGRKLSNRLTPAQNAALDAALAPLGLPPRAFDSYEPWFVTVTLAVAAAQRLGVGAADGPEALLMRAARARSIAVGELEGVQWQFLLFDGMPYAQQIAQLVETLEHNDELDEELAPMLAAWSAGDVERLVAIIDAGREQDPALHRLLFAGRNANWASWIQLRLRRPGTVFLAVGAGHLAGRDSVQAQLARRGIHAERVPHVEAN
ncbi:MAG TPA: TraB/GumN family protein, partial [Allosphingosinicella sp.]|nr:TraB/GumN family protein [Allosphingosinicella sp.]